MKEFNLESFKEAVLLICRLKKENPYRRDAWKCSDVLVKKCGAALEQIAEEVAALFRDVSIQGYQGRVGRGMGFYPKCPGIMFLNEREQPRNGIYPVLTFFENGEGFYVACEESRACPQVGFSKLARQSQYLSQGDGWDEHVGAATRFDRMEIERISEQGLLDAFKKAILLHSECRHGTMRTKMTSRSLS